MTTTFEYKPAPMSRRVRVEIAEASATLRDADGSVVDHVEFGSAQDARYVELSQRDFTSRWLDIDHASGRFRIGCNTMRLATREDEDFGTYIGAARAVLTGLAQRAPHVDVAMGTGGRTRWAFFLSGTVAFLIGVGLPLAAWLTDVRTKKIMAGLFPSALLVLFGLFLMAVHSPFSPRPRVSTGDLAEALSGEAPDTL